MQTAQCSGDGRDYDAHAFSRLGPDTITEKRRYLTCLGCGRRAFFRAKAKDGRAPHFGSNAHADHCEFVGTGTRSVDGGAQEVEPERVNLGNRMTIDLTTPDKDPRPVHAVPDTKAVGRRPVPLHVADDGAGGAGSAMSHRRLRPILRDLVASPAFRRSDVRVELDGFTALPVSRFFVHFDSINDNRHRGQKRGYWGTVVDARHGADGALWLNSGGRDDPSVRLAGDETRELFANFDINDLEELAGAWVLALGRFHVSEGGKRYIADLSASQVAIRMPD